MHACIGGPSLSPSAQAEVLTGVPVGDVETAKQAVNRLLARGPGCVVLTLGAGGVVFSGRGSEDTDTLTHIPAESVATVDTTVGHSPSLRSPSIPLCILYRELGMHL